MAKPKVSFICSGCQSTYSRWQGQCSSCGEWNLIDQQSSDKPSAGGWSGDAPRRTKLSDISIQELTRVVTPSDELNRVLGGGFVPGSVVLLGGHPGAGKSTLLLQVTSVLAAQRPVLYVSGEESLQQIAVRAQRLGLDPEHLELMAETRVEAILAAAEDMQPAVIVVDSIQVTRVAELTATPGSVTQVRESAAVLTRHAKQTGQIVIMVGHVTKEGSLAGPKVLEHMIDASLLLEGDGDGRYRTLRAIKNRFGTVNELGIFGMTDKGLREVREPSAIFLDRPETPSPGSAVAITREGTRPLLVEIQGLVDAAHGNPRRVAVGLDTARLGMLLAVLHRHGNILIGDQDVFANVVGGVRLTETGGDLALVLALVSSFRGRALPADLAVFGEIGLGGEIRPVSGGQERIIEASKHGFKRLMVPAANQPKTQNEQSQVRGVRTLAQALTILDEWS
ncbi:MAG: DNA repair protein RadA [Litorivicinus sp.]